ncbi:hypothetical protein FJZ21_00860 [Candidatus Pacearchaeota archaeon]|nr:hypothetical protein [Candidatus Pacearchaeota archaeon]
MVIKRFILVIAFIFCISYASSLGISPAIKNINFESGKQTNITFYVLDAVEGVEYDVNIRGGYLAQYSSVNTNSVVGSGSFILSINFPEKIDLPGEHTVSVSVKERPSETSFINTLVEVGSIIKTFVPYPGYYGDLSLNILDVNVNDQISVELYLINRGDNPLEIKEVYVDFVSSTGKAVKRIEFTPVTIPVSGDRYFRKYAETSGIEPGNYIATGRVSYRDITREVNRSFRVGSLFVNITNYTSSIRGDGIQRFYVTLDSMWNSPIYGAYVDVNLTNGVYSTVFRTPSIDIMPWEQKTIESYIDTENLDGYYDLYFNASYHGQSTLATGRLYIGDNYGIIIYSVSALLAILFFIALYIILKRLFFKKRR